MVSPFNNIWVDREMAYQVNHLLCSVKTAFGSSTPTYMPNKCYRQPIYDPSAQQAETVSLEQAG